MINKKEVIVFSKSVAPGEKGTVAERIKADATVQEVTAKFYFGQERALKVNPYIHKTRNRIEQLLTYPEGTDPFIAGDDDYFKYDTAVEVSNDDFVKVDFENTSVDNAYDLVVTVTVDYLGGKQRAW